MKNYNTTDLDPKASFEKHVFHRDQFGHYLRWTKILKDARIGDKIIDFGCGKGGLLEVLYRNRFKCKWYKGYDIREKTVNTANEKFENVEWAEFFAADLVKDIFLDIADKVCAFEVIEHIGKQNVDDFMTRFKACGHDNTKFYLSTPNYDEKVGAAGNHTFDSGDGRGVTVQEFSHEELEDVILRNGFVIEEKFGVFASMSDYKDLMNDWQKEMFENLRKYYDTNLISVMMAPFFPENSRNTLWILRKKGFTK